jgi:hypothetical protein
MRALAIFLLATTTAFAQDTSLCVGVECLEPALLAALSEAGLRQVDGLGLVGDGTDYSLTIISPDEDGLARIVPSVRAERLSLPGLYVKTVPIDLSAIDTITLPGAEGPILMPGVYIEEAGSGGGGAGGGDCYESCVCTEDGPECWIECP